MLVPLYKNKCNKLIEYYLRKLSAFVFMDYQCFYLNLQRNHSYNFMHHKSPISYHVRVCVHACECSVHTCIYVLCVMCQVLAVAVCVTSLGASV